MVGSPFKNWVRCGPAPLRLGVAAGYPMKYVHLPLFHHAEFGRSTSNGVGISKGCPKNFGTSRPLPWDGGRAWPLTNTIRRKRVTLSVQL